MAIYPAHPADTYFTFVQFEFGALRQSSQLVEANLQSMIERRQLPGWDGRTIEAGPTVKPRFSAVDYLIPHTLRTPFLVSVWGLYEATITLVGETLAAKSGKQAGAPPWTNNVQRCARQYLRREFGLMLNSSDRVKQEIIEFHNLRNVLTHANGWVNAAPATRRERVIKLAARGIGLDISHGFVSPAPQFVDRCFDLVAGELQWLLSSAQDWLRHNVDPAFL